jgi:hypothetical protein
MTDLLDAPATQAPTPSTNGTAAVTGTPAPAAKLRKDFRATRVQFTAMGTRKALTDDQREQIGQLFEADGAFVGASKKLVNTKHKAYRRVVKVRSRARSTWHDATLPYPEPGLRLLPEAKISWFDDQMRQCRSELDAAVADLDAAFEEMREEARERLGSLFDPADYPATLVGVFSVFWDFPSVEPPDYLLRLKPALYEQEQAKIAARFEEAVRLAEQAFTEEFGAAVEALCERLTGTNDDGKPKVFRDTAIGNLTDFFERFKGLNVGSNAELEALVEQARAAVAGTTPTALRDSGTLRAEIAAQLGQVGAALGGMMVDKPRRNINRKARATQAQAPAGDDAPAPEPEAAAVA